jgi:hypothetical protein
MASKAVPCEEGLTNKTFNVYPLTAEPRGACNVQRYGLNYARRRAA